MKLMDILNVPFGYVMQFFYKLIPSYAIDLLLFALFMKIILLPLSIKQQKNMIKQASLRPKEMAIRAKYAGRNDKVTQQKLSNEIMDFYQKEGYSPFGGCLPLLLQFPIVIALYNVVRSPLTYICHLGDYIADLAARAGELFEAKNLTEISLVGYLRDSYESFADVLPESFSKAQLPSFQIFGGAIDLGSTPSISQIGWLLLVPILVVVSSYVSMVLTRKLSYQPPQNENGDAAVSSKFMDFTMPLFSGFLSFTLPALLGVYWIYQSVLGVVQQAILYKLMPYPEFTEEDYKNAEREVLSSSKRKKERYEEAKKRSLHHIDDDEVAAAEKKEEPQEDLSRDELPPLKEDRMGNLSEKRKTGSKEPVRSLHHIDDDEYDHGVWKGKGWKDRENKDGK